MSSAVVRLSVPLPGPLDLAISLQPLGRSGDDGLDRWDGRLLVRTIRLPSSGPPVAYVGVPQGSLEEPWLEVELERPLDARAASEAIGVTIAPDRAAVSAIEQLAGLDAAVRALKDRYPGLCPVRLPDPFTALVRSISAQQVNLRWAAEVRRRLAQAFGRRHEVGGTVVASLQPEVLARASIADLRALQLTTAKARSVIACAATAAEGRLEHAELEALDDDEVIARLTTLPGIGRWSAEWFLARTLGRPRVVAGDLGVRKAVGRMYQAGALPTEPDVRRMTHHWAAAASLVQALALHDLAEAETAARTKRKDPPAAPPAG